MTNGSCRDGPHSMSEDVGAVKDTCMSGKQQ